MRYLLLGLLLPAVVSAQGIDTIDGLISNGETLIIYGSGFGVDNGYANAPIFCERFEDAGAAHEDFITEHNSNWVTGHGTYNLEPMYEAYMTPAGTGFSMRWVDPDTTLPYEFDDSQTTGNPNQSEHVLARFFPADRRPGFGDKVCWAWRWAYEFPGAHQASELPQQWKIGGPSHWEGGTVNGNAPDYYAPGDGGGNQFNPMLSLKWSGIALEPPCPLAGYIRFESINNRGQNHSTQTLLYRCGTTELNIPPQMTWMQHEAYYQISSEADAADGHLTTWTGNEYGTETRTDSDMLDYDSTQALRDFHYGCVRIGRWIGDSNNPEPVGYQPHSGYWDDLWMSDSWCAPVLTDSDIWLESTIRERLVPSAWSNTEITCEVYTGVFPNEAQAWLWVQIADGTVVGPTEVEINSDYEGEPDLAPPGAPTGTRTGDSIPLSWTASVPAAARYVVMVDEGNGPRRAGVVEDGSTTSITLQVSSSAELSMYVIAYNAFGELQSKSTTTVIGGS